MSESAKWYVIHTYSGYENKVATSIEKIIENRKLQEVILEVKVPTEKVVELRNNERVEIERKLFPGYVLLNMIINDDTWILIKGIRGVTGFVGPEGKPIALTKNEIESLGFIKESIQVPYVVGDNVRVTDGSLKGFTGTVDEIDVQKGKVRVIVSMFGRETPVELDIEQLEVLAI
ncbi:MAG: NusG antitermination factor [Clostridia bacterium]|jgi:transcriptional antiterminator NusG|nr:NusG antitermination factor [Clostridia bacterium]